METTSPESMALLRESAEFEEYAVVTVNLTKKYNSKSRSLGSLHSIHNFSQLGGYFSILLGRGQRNLVALSDVSLSIRRGEVFGLLGPNGAGKTTFIKILSTLVLPDSGSAYVHGIDVVKQPYAALERLQAVLSEGIGFERRLTGRQNLQVYASLYGLPSSVAKERIDSLLEMVGLAGKANRTMNRYSTGMARKLLLCRALLSDASVLVFDEPTAGLDPNAAAEFRNVLTDVIVRERGKTVLMSSHNLWEVQQICDRVAVLNQGKVVAVGSPDEIRVGAGESISLTVAGVFSANVVIANLRSDILRVAGVSVVRIDQGGSSEVVIELEGTRDLDYTSIFSLLLDKGFRIRSLDAPQPSLEEAFIKLTREIDEWPSQ